LTAIVGGAVSTTCTARSGTLAAGLDSDCGCAASTDEEGRQLQRIVRRGGGKADRSIVRWRRSMVVLASAGGNSVDAIPRLVQTSPDQVREMLHRFSERGMASLDPRWAGGPPRRITTDAEALIVATAKARLEEEPCPTSPPPAPQGGRRRGLPSPASTDGVAGGRSGCGHDRAPSLHVEVTMPDERRGETLRTPGVKRRSSPAQVRH